MIMFLEYDVIVVGVGYLGCEVVVVVVNLGFKVMFVIMNMNIIVQMFCNLVMGGVVKGQIVWEIDVLGGYFGIVIDYMMVQFCMFNCFKGLVMWSLWA